MKEYIEVINSKDVLNVVEGRITIEELKTKILNEYYRYCRDGKEKQEALKYVQDAFEFIEPFLESITQEEFDAVSKYGRKIGAMSYEINDGLRENQQLNGENKQIVKLLDSAIQKFNLNEEIVVYRALKTKDNVDFDFKDMVGKKYTEKGYMSTALSKEASYAYFKDYDVVLEITLPKRFKMSIC